MKPMANMIRFYFGQTENYMSTSSGTLISIDTMASSYAANAAKRLLIDARIWHEDAGETDGRNAVQWMLGTPLWNSLWLRSQVK